MNIFQPIKLTDATQTTIREPLPESKRRFHIYIPSAMNFLMMRYADELRQMLVDNRLPYKKENRIIRTLCEDYRRRWDYNMKLEHKVRFEKIVDDLYAMFYRHFQTMFFTLDAVMLKHEPDNDYHNIATHALLVEFICSYCVRLDKEAYEALRDEHSVMRREWVPDYAVIEIQRAANIISNGLSMRRNADLSKDKQLFDQIRLAIDVINEKLENYTFVI